MSMIARSAVLALVAGSVLGFAATSASAQTVNLNAAAPTSSTSTGMIARFVPSAGGGFEQRIASHSSGTPSTPQWQQQANWANTTPATYTFSLTYTASVSWAFTMTDAAGTSQTTTWTFASGPNLSQTAFNALSIQIGANTTTGQPTSQIGLSNLSLTGVSTTGTFTNMFVDAPLAESQEQWAIANSDLSASTFTLSGTVAVAWTGTGNLNERLVMNIRARNVEIIPLPPAAMAGTVTLLGLGGLSAFRRRR